MSIGKSIKFDNIQACFQQAQGAVHKTTDLVARLQDLIKERLLVETFLDTPSKNPLDQAQITTIQTKYKQDLQGCLHAIVGNIEETNKQATVAQEENPQVLEQLESTISKIQTHLDQEESSPKIQQLYEDIRSAKEQIKKETSTLQLLTASFPKYFSHILPSEEEIDSMPEADPSLEHSVEPQTPEDRQLFLVRSIAFLKNQRTKPSITSEEEKEIEKKIETLSGKLQALEKKHHLPPPLSQYRPSRIQRIRIKIAQYLKQPQSPPSRKKIATIHDPKEAEIQPPPHHAFSYTTLAKNAVVGTMACQGLREMAFVAGHSLKASGLFGSLVAGGTSLARTSFLPAAGVSALLPSLSWKQRIVTVSVGTPTALFAGPIAGMAATALTGTVLSKVQGQQHVGDAAQKVIQKPHRKGIKVREQKPSMAQRKKTHKEQTRKDREKKVRRKRDPSGPENKEQPMES